MWRSPYHIEPLREDRNYIRPRVQEPRGSPSDGGPWRRASEVCQFFCVNDQVLFLGTEEGILVESLRRLLQNPHASSTGAPMGVAIARLAALSPVTP